MKSPTPVYTRYLESNNLSKFKLVKMQFLTETWFKKKNGYSTFSAAAENGMTFY